jgi:serine/threonine-protein kinase
MEKLVLKRRYELVRKLASGKTTEVYLARDRIEGTEIVVKVLYPQLASDPDFNAAFRSSARRALRLEHAGLVKVLDYGVEDDRVYVVEEFVKERTLGELLAEGKVMKPQGALYFALEVGRILEYLHSEGITHGSLDEGHVFIFPRRRAKLSDPGFPTTLSGWARPYPPLMEPHRDIRDLGYLIYRSVTGRSEEEANRDIREGFLIWGEGVPSRLRKLVESCLASDGRHGYGEVTELLRETISSLREEQPMVPVPSLPTAWREEAGEEPPAGEGRPARWRLWAAVASATLAAILLVFWLVSTVIGHSKVMVPNLVHMDLYEAQKVAADADLGLLVVGRAHYADVRANCVASQDPKPGVMVRKKTVIKVLESLGPLVVPNLSGLDLDAAKLLLEQRGFRVGKVIYRETDEYKEDVVIESDPPYGGKLSEGAPVDLVVSKRPG